MTTEEHKGNEDQNLRRMMAIFPNYHFGERPKSPPFTEIDGFADENSLFPSLLSVELPYIDLWPN